MQDLGVTKHSQASAFASPWSKSELLKSLIWEISWTLFCRWTPKPLNRWRLGWLRCYGCKIIGRPFVHQRSVINKPWNLILHDRACLGDRSVVYALGIIEIEDRATIAQEAYLCAGSHEFSDPNLPLLPAKVTIKADAFVGARAFVMPGITIPNGVVIGAMSVVTKEMPEWTVCAGNPCKPLKPRILREL